MIPKLLAGIETEYGLAIEGRGAETQIDDAAAFVRAFPDECFFGWDYRQESPRADLRGFRLDRLQVDPEDAKYEKFRRTTDDQESRSDRVLLNGARLYNDHGHPEYSTPECWSLEELVLHDLAGEMVMRQIAEAFDRPVRIFKNNTDFHGASYGTHESYLCPRRLGFDGLYSGVMPILLARQILTGSGKVGSESGQKCSFQISQRADFLSEAYNAETLFRRPLFNTRDEPHADPARFIRLHVISGDANMSPTSTFLKVGLVKVAIALAEVGESPAWRIADPVRSFHALSRDQTCDFRVELEGGNWTNAYEVIESYLAAAERVFGFRAESLFAVEPTNLEEKLNREMAKVVLDSRKLMSDLRECPDRAASKIDWAAKKKMLEQFLDQEGGDWSDPQMQALDLQYHDLNPEDGLYFALHELGEVEPRPGEERVLPRTVASFELNRAVVRGLAAARFADKMRGISWSSLTFDLDGREREVYLDPEVSYPAELAGTSDVGEFIALIEAANA